MTLVILSPHNTHDIDCRGIKTILYTNKFDPKYLTEDLLHYRKKSVFLPTTKYMAWIDSDDLFPPDVDVCDLFTRLMILMEHDGNYLGYTDEIMRIPGQTDILQHKLPYDRKLYEERPYDVMHNTVIMNTEVAQAVSDVLPEGIHWVEMLFHLYVAEFGCGASHISEPGYIWNRVESPDRIHVSPSYMYARQNSAEFARINLPIRSS